MEQTIKIVNLLLGVVQFAEDFGVNVDKVIAAKKQAQAEGRDLSDAEMKQFHDEAVAHVKALENS